MSGRVLLGTLMWTCVSMITVPTSRVIEAQAQHPRRRRGLHPYDTRDVTCSRVPLVWNSTLVSQQLAKTIETYAELLYIDHQRELAKRYQNDQGIVFMHVVACAGVSTED
jgi:hypothetical protein